MELTELYIKAGYPYDNFFHSCNKEYSPKFPSNVKSIVNYDETIKSLVVYLNSYCNVPNQKTVNGRIMSTIGVFTKGISIVEAFANRKLESFKEMGILDRYIGTVCHDHNTIHQSFSQSKQAECNFHILRYCKAEYEVHKRESIKEFMNYLLELRDKVDEYKIQGRTAFTEKEYEEAKSKYLELVDIWYKEFKKDYDKGQKQYYNSERCLITRLKEYVDDHLRFLTDFRIDFTNNLAERGLRKIKTKLKIAGGFRSLKFARFYCDAISIIDTCKKQNMNIFETIKNIFNICF